MSGVREAGYRLLLLLLPRAFRKRHGSAMEETFRRMHERARGGGMRAVLGLWLREVADVARAGAALRAQAARGRRSADRRGRLAGALRDDAQLALRAMLRHRGFLLLAAMTLGLGVGATTAMYSALRAVVLSPVPFREPDRLVLPWRTMGTSGALIGLESSDIDLVRSEPGLFEQVEEFAAGSLTLTDGSEPLRVTTLRMTPGLLALLGTPPLFGRSVTRAETAEGARVLLLSHALWRQRYGARDDIIGQSITADGESWTIVGVMPPAAGRPDGDARPIDVWLPLPDGDWNRSLVARLAPGVTFEAADARVDDLLRGNATGAFGGRLLPLVRPGPLHEHMRILMVAVLLLLLVACVNLANLLLQRAAERRGELAVRAALGAGRLRLVRQLLLESLLLSGAGALLGVAFAWLGLRALLALRPAQLEELRTVRIDGDVFTFCLLAAVTAGFIVGLLPALRGTRPHHLATVGRRTLQGAGTVRARWLLVSTEVALSFALLTGALLVATSLRELARRDPGYDVAGLIAADVRLPSWRYTQAAARADVFERMMLDVRRHHAVRDVALADGVPPRIGGYFGRIQLHGQPRDDSPTQFDGADIDTAFLAIIGQHLIAGRGFTQADIGGATNSVLLSASTARRMFGDDALGQRFALEGGPEQTVIGIVRDIHPLGLAEATDRPFAYWPLRSIRSRMNLVVRADQTTPQLLADLRTILRAAEPDAIIDVVTVSELLGASLARERFTTILLAAFSLLALLLTAVGLYGVLAQVVLSRTREFGVRVALGATAARIAGLVFRSAAAALATGLLAGSLLAVAGTDLLRSRIFGIADHSARSWASAATVLLVVTILALSVPALRAARVEPMRSIRADG